MLISKKNRTAVYKFLFSEGVCYALKDYGIPHPEIKFGEGEDDFVPNLQVIKLMQSLTSQEIVKEQYAWRHFYWFLTDKGVEYLRSYLNIPEDVVPNTQMKTNRNFEKTPARGGPGGPRGDRGDRPPRREGDRAGYRSVLARLPCPPHRRPRSLPTAVLLSTERHQCARVAFSTAEMDPPVQQWVLRASPASPFLQLGDTPLPPTPPARRGVRSPPCPPRARCEAVPCLLRFSCRPRGEGAGDKAGAPAGYRPAFGDRQ